MNDVGTRLNRLGLALLVGLVGGVSSVLIDLDHLILPLSRGEWPTLTNLGGRELHFTCGLVVGIVLLLAVARYAGFLVALSRGKR